MTRISFSNYGQSAFEKIIGHNEAILENWVNLENVFFTSTGLDDNLLEQVRRTLAFENECEYCMVKEGRPSFDENQKRIMSACAFAELFAIDHKSIMDYHFAMLRENFTEKEISELCTFISFITASQRLGRICNLKEEYQLKAVTTMADLKKQLKQ